MKKYLILLAGGKGTRMQSEKPKQFIAYESKPILFHTLENILSTGLIDNLVIILPIIDYHLWKDYFYDINKGKNYKSKITLEKGGNTRFESVKNGLKHVPKGVVLFIHDGVRPFVNKDLIKRLLATTLETKKATIPVLPIKSSLMVRATNKSLKSIDRENYLEVQTPQCFISDKIKAAYQQPYDTSFTDDASVYQTIYSDNLIGITGLSENIKITTQLDLKLAALVSKDFKP